MTLPMSVAMRPAETMPDIRPGERLRILRAIEAVLRIQRLVQDYYPDDDMETVAVLLTVAAGSMSIVNRDETAYQMLLEGPLPAEMFRPISGRAVAASCGLPREFGASPPRAAGTERRDRTRRWGLPDPRRPAGAWPEPGVFPGTGTRI